MRLVDQDGTGVGPGWDILLLLLLLLLFLVLDVAHGSALDDLVRVGLALLQTDVGVVGEGAVVAEAAAALPEMNFWGFGRCCLYRIIFLDGQGCTYM